MLSQPWYNLLVFEDLSARTFAKFGVNCRLLNLPEHHAAGPNAQLQLVIATTQFSWGWLIQWHVVVICIWCALFVTSQFDVIFMFANQRFTIYNWKIKLRQCLQYEQSSRESVRLDWLAHTPVCKIESC